MMTNYPFPVSFRICHRHLLDSTTSFKVTASAVGGGKTIFGELVIDREANPCGRTIASSLFLRIAAALCGKQQYICLNI